MFSSIYTDAGIVRRVLRGHTEAFSVLVDRYGSIVYGIVYARTGNAADAEELTQDVFVRLYQWLDRVASRASVGPWLVEVARNAATDLLRKRQRERPLLEDIHAAAARDFAREEMRRMVWEQLAGLDESHREVLILHYFQGVKIREIARLLNISGPAAKKRLQRSRDELGRRLVAAVGEETAAAEKNPRRARRVLAAIASSPAAWQPSASLSLAGAAIVGASAAKVVGGLAVVALIAIGLFAGWRHVNRPYDTQNITEQSEFSVDKKAAPLKAATSTGEAAPAAVETAAPEESSDQSGSRKVAHIVLYGLVVGEDGRPVPKATVTVDNKVCFSRYESMSKDASFPEAVDSIDVSVVADSEGKFYVDSVPIGTNWNLSELRVSACAPGLFGEKTVRCIAGMLDCYVEVGVKADCALDGLVFDEAGGRVPEAVVSIYGAYEMTQIPDIKTAADGSFALPHLGEGFYNIYVDCRGFVPLQETRRIDAGRQTLVLRLRRGNSISGRITLAADGSPLADKTIMATTSVSGNSAKSDAAGHFTISGLEFGMFTLRLGKDAAPYVISGLATVDLPENEPVTGVELKVVKGATISGRVVDERTGAPVPKTMVRFAVPDGTRTVANTWADDQGRYSVSPLCPGSYEVLLWSDTQLTRTTFTVPSYADMEGVDFKIAPHYVIRGKVIDANGNPVAGASVAAAPWREITQFTESDAKGQFEFRMSREVLPVYCQAFSSGLVSRLEGPIRGDANITLALEASARIEGVVVDTAGRPQPNLIVAAVPDNRDRITLLTPEGRPWEQSEGIDGTCARTLLSGSFQLDPVLPGAYTLEVYTFSSPAGYPAATATASVQAGQTLTTRLVLNTGALSAIEGTVLVGGAPAKGVRVAAKAEGEEWFDNVQTFTDAGGWYRIANVRPGPVTVEVTMMSSSERGHRTQEVLLEAGQTATVNFDIFESAAGIDGYVTMNGQPMLAYVEVKPAEAAGDSARITSQLDGAGYYRVANLDDGQYEVAVSDVFKSDRVFASALVDVKGNAFSRQDFEIPGGAVEAVVSGLREGEKAFVAIFPGTTDFSVLSAALGQEIVDSAQVAPGEPVTFSRLLAGPYSIAAAAVTIDRETDEAAVFAAIAKGRFTILPLDILPGETASANLAIP